MEIYINFYSRYIRLLVVFFCCSISPVKGHQQRSLFYSPVHMSLLLESPLRFIDGNIIINKISSQNSINPLSHPLDISRHVHARQIRPEDSWKFHHL